MSIEPSVVRSRSEARPPRQRSAVTNGRRMFVDGDGNAAWSRRWRDLVEAHEGDLGGASGLSEAQSSLIRRVATIEIELEQLEGKLSKGEAVDLDVYTRSSSHLRRILESLGLERRARDVTPTLSEYLASKYPRNDSPAAKDSVSVGDGVNAASDSEKRASGLPSEAGA